MILHPFETPLSSLPSLHRPFFSSQPQHQGEGLYLRMWGLRSVGIAVFFILLRAYFPFQGLERVGRDGAGLLGSDESRGAADPGLLPTLLCWPPCPSAGTALGWGKRWFLQGVLQAGCSRPLFRTISQSSSMLQVEGSMAHLPLGAFCIEAWEW